MCCAFIKYQLYLLHYSQLWWHISVAAWRLKCLHFTHIHSMAALQICLINYLQAISPDLPFYLTRFQLYYSTRLRIVIHLVFNTVSGVNCAFCLVSRILVIYGNVSLTSLNVENDSFSEIIDI